MFTDEFGGGIGTVPSNIFIEYQDSEEEDCDDEAEAIIIQSIQKIHMVPPATMRLLFIMKFVIVDRLLDRTWRIK